MMLGICWFFFAYLIINEWDKCVAEKFWVLASPLLVITKYMSRVGLLYGILATLLRRFVTLSTLQNVVYFLPLLNIQLFLLSNNFSNNGPFLLVVVLGLSMKICLDHVLYINFRALPSFSIQWPVNISARPILIIIVWARNVNKPWVVIASHKLS